MLWVGMWFGGGCVVIALQYQFSCRYIGVLEFGIIYFFWLENKYIL